MEKALIQIFNAANRTFLIEEVDNIQNGVSERNLCGRLAMYLRDIIRDSDFAEYHVDPEYNRNYGGRVKTILDGENNEIVINCDIIIHSRGQNIIQDNLVAFEMKKSNRSDEDKDADRSRLRALTKASYDGVWTADGVTLPEHVCGYIWGIYIELDSNNREELIEYYQHGELVDYETLDY